MTKRILFSLFSVSALALMLAATPVLAAEVDVEAHNVTTGADSDNENEFDIDNDGNVNTNNTANVSHNASANADTGGNDQNENTTAGDLETGTVDASTDWETVANGGAALMGASSSELEVKGDFTNDTTGFNSDNENELDIDNDGDFALNNLANIANALGLTATTGDNNQNQNTTAGDTDTGDVTAKSMVHNEANNGSGFSGASYGMLTVDVDGKNHKTGANSDNDNDFDIDNDGDVTVNNTANLSTSTSVNANTGGNDQNQNTTGGDLKTGKVEVTTEVHNKANNGGTSTAAAKELSVKGDFTNDTTGSNSDNDNDLDIDNDGDTTVNNTANVTNAVGVVADSGNNNQNQNTSGGNTETGAVKINFSSTTEVNSN